ncbi:NBS-LRR-like resistance protein [Rhynchospora pubera]|uniref:NBS-LRR-like resistance protein n=1 Tax=Rhynchospora pubera TaxID=906938 RepID=A0AAV8DX12_9POAL|nr:NBS-LRR-like resistance protein [Rhynchospora pubera]
MALNMVLSPVISVAVKKAGDALIEQICQMWGMDNNLNKLHRQLEAIQRKIVNAEESGAPECWIKELDAAAHEAVDVLDEFQYEALRRNAIRQGASAKVIKGFFSSENSVVFRYKMSNKLIKILGKIDEIVTEMYKFNLVQRDLATSIDRETYSSVEKSEVIGRDDEKEMIISQLLDPQRERENISVLAIIGMGGLGKTTLAQLVYNDERVKGHFHPMLLWVCVSIEFNFNNICKSIIEVATNGKENVSTLNNKEVLQRKVREILGKKRYLLILDDVWNEEIGKWDELRKLLFSEAGSGSVIIVTTRSQGVASIMGTLPGHDLASLNKKDSLWLFERKAFGGWAEEPQEEFRKIGETIAGKCLGVPLAVNTIGVLMGTKREVGAWRAISENNIWDYVKTENDILPILKLSYDHLPSHIKRCFAFCAIFPQDYEINRETLIQLWMANDFIPTDESMKNLEIEGQSIFNELYKRSFFQNYKEEESNYGSIISCKMHDLMLDLATKIAGNKCANNNIHNANDPGIILKEVHHLHQKTNVLQINNVLKKFPSIRTCLIDVDSEYEQWKMNSHLLKSSSLRALQFKTSLPPRELGKHIRYLDISFSGFTTLPETISRLYNLQTLKLSYSRINELPTEMRYMINLRHLFLDNCHELQRMPIGLGLLKYLQTLTKYVVDSGRGGTIGELNNLNLLCGHISLSGLENVRDGKDAQFVNLAKKTNLCSLELKWDRINNEEATTNDQEVLEALIPHKEIKYFVINGYNSSDFPKWMMEDLNIRNLKELKLKKCINCAEIPAIWQLPLLENLHLEKMDSLRHIVGGMGKYVEGSESLITFSVLKVLLIIDLPNLENWREGDSDLLDFPNLNTLFITECGKLKSMLVHMPLLASLRVCNSNCGEILAIQQLPLLENLHLEEVESLRHIVGDTGKHVRASKSLITFLGLKVLTISDLPNLEAWHEENSDLVDFPNLNDLVIEDCDKLKSIPVRMPLLAYLRVYNSSKIKLHNISNLPTLSRLDIQVVNSCSEPDAFRPPKTVETMEIRGFDNVNPLEEEEGEDQLISCQTKSLRKLTIEMCNCFFSSGPTKVVALGFWKYFEVLEHLEIYYCDAIEFWPEKEFKSLKCLKKLQINYCWNLRGSLKVAASVSSSCEHMEDSLPHLESLHISNCPELVEIPICSKSLTSLNIWGCPKLSREGLTHLTNLSELKTLNIHGLTNWGVWPDNMEHLPSLENLIILYCPGIGSFPEGLQQRLSSLRLLEIQGCPTLERRCRVGGDYWHLVSRIPDLRLSLEVNERQSFSKRLLNCMRGR